jgi:hypothetical protein
MRMMRQANRLADRPPLYAVDLNGNPLDQDGGE